MALIGCRSGGTPPPVATPAVGAAGEYRVYIREFKFDPPEIIVPRGSTVTFTNLDYTPHTATDGPGERFDSGLISYGKTYAHTYNTTGRFPYLCVPHPGMRGAVVVE